MPLAVMAGWPSGHHIRPHPDIYRGGALNSSSRDGSSHIHIPVSCCTMNAATEHAGSSAAGRHGAQHHVGVADRQPCPPRNRAACHAAAFVIVCTVRRMAGRRLDPFMHGPGGHAVRIADRHRLLRTGSVGLRSRAQAPLGCMQCALPRRSGCR